MNILNKLYRFKLENIRWDACIIFLQKKVNIKTMYQIVY